MRIPRKKELIELQRKYRTDKKIGEVYGVPSRLVAYWRQKKKIGMYSFPKYPEEKILELWERYGNDARAGSELGISAAGFRQWRRRYNINKKPLQLRLEQLELGLTDPGQKKNTRRETAVQKILARKSGLKRAEIGQVVTVEPDLTVAHENTKELIEKFHGFSRDHVWDPGRIVIVLDQQVPAKSSRAAENQRIVREFVKKHKIRSFYDIGEGVGHQVVIENGHILPGQLAFGTDWHSSSYGCLGALSTSLSPDEMAAVWATGRIWVRVPESVRIVIKGYAGRGVYARDIILKLMRDLPPDTVNYRSIEFSGPTVTGMTISERFTLTNAAMEMGAKSAMVGFDDATARYMKRISKAKLSPLISDYDAVYSAEIEIDVSYLTPQVGLSADSRNVVAVEEATGRKIDLVVVGSCASGRLDDLEIAARILKGRRIHRDIRMIVVPGSRRVLSEALDRGLIKTFIDSGCVVVNPGCDPCMLADSGNLAPGEKALTTATHVQNGSGTDGTEVYSSSPATASATALEGVIADPRKYDR